MLEFYGGSKMKILHLKWVIKRTTAKIKAIKIKYTK